MATGASADIFTFSIDSVWRNKSGSILTLREPHPITGEVTGTYANKSSGSGCQNTPYPVVGYVSGNFIGWAVHWKNDLEDCNSITNWTGYVFSDGGAEKIKMTTEWTLVYGSSQIISGKDIFVLER
jgi:hypothetical protein